ncbi:MAG: hypothetical protein J6U94_00445 [Paludibacteraceae bacterium]|nr:hypothetical protein [Paludibacteraceae bacterium]
MSAVVVSISLEELIPYINWTYFFNAWHIPGNYEGITSLCTCEACRQQWLSRFSAAERPKAQEALQLYLDAQVQLKEWNEQHTLTIQVKYGFYDATSSEQVITLCNDSECLKIPTLRQQRPRPDGTCWALADFIAAEADTVGLFAVAVHGVNEVNDDEYISLLRRTLADRLAEATSEFMQRKLLSQNAIRPAFGYPSLPDLSLLFDVERFFTLSEIGIHLTHHAAMKPTSSICGLYIQHPQVRYFMVGDISMQQFTWYAKQRNMSLQALKPFLNLNVLP